MPRRIGRIKWYVGAACVVAAVVSSSAVALAQAQTQSGPGLSSSHGGSGPGTVNGPGGQFVRGNGKVPPAAPAGSTLYGWKGSGSGKVVKSYPVSAGASVRHGADARGPRLSSSHSGSGPGTVNGPGGQFVAGNGRVPPTAPAGSASLGRTGSGSGKTTAGSP